MRTTVVLTALAPLLVLSCQIAPEPRECLEEEEVFVFIDADGDGYGTDPLFYTCSVGDEQALNSLDCNDDDPTVSPDSPELCDGLDNNCDGRTDEGLPNVSYFPDLDGDGFGNSEEELVSCSDPGPGWVVDANDCDDDNEDRFPGNIDLCDNGIDEDCSGVADDAAEVCNDGIDNDCDGIPDCDDSDCFSSAQCLLACADLRLPSTESVTATGTFAKQTDDWTLMTDGCVPVRENGEDIALQWEPPTTGTYRVFVPNMPISMAVMRDGCSGIPFDACDQPLPDSITVDLTLQAVAGQTWIIVLDSNMLTTDWQLEIRRLL